MPSVRVENRRNHLVIRWWAYLLIPHVLQACDAQLLQAGALWVRARPSEWAKKSEITRVVRSLWQAWQGMGVSASLIGRRASKRVRQSRQTYS
jgi:hypothetical protein